MVCSPFPNTFRAPLILVAMRAMVRLLVKVRYLVRSYWSCVRMRSMAHSTMSAVTMGVAGGMMRVCAGG
jgi:hypothetical protein